MQITRFAHPVLLAAGAVALCPVAASAQDTQRYRVTLGAQFKPQFPGADDVRVLPMVDLDRERGDAPFEYEAADDSFGFTLVKANGFEFGPSVDMVSPRKAKDVGALVPEVKRTFELGGFANLWLGDGFRLHGELRQAVNGHDGLVADAGADLVMRDGDTWLFSIGPRAKWASGKYMDAYYGVTAPTATATGLPLYDPRSGIESYGIAATTDFALTPRWGISLFGKYDRLTGDAAKSPIVAAYGSRDQFSAGAGISYTFGR